MANHLSGEVSWHQIDIIIISSTEYQNFLGLLVGRMCASLTLVLELLMGRI